MKQHSIRVEIISKKLYFQYICNTDFHSSYGMLIQKYIYISEPFQKIGITCQNFCFSYIDILQFLETKTKCTLFIHIVGFMEF